MELSSSLSRFKELRDLEDFYLNRTGWLFVLGGVAFHCLLFAFVPLRWSDSARAISPANVVYEPGEQFTSPVLREQALLFDSAAFFLPSEWGNASDFSHLQRLADVAAPFGNYSIEPAFPQSLLPQSDPVATGWELASRELPQFTPSWTLGMLGRSEVPLISRESVTPPTATLLSLSNETQPSRLPNPEFFSRIFSHPLPAFYIHIQYGSLQLPVLRDAATIAPGTNLFEAGSNPFMESIQNLPDGYFRLELAP